MNTLRAGEEVATDIVRYATGADLSDHNPSNLQIIDRLLGPEYRDAVKRNEKTNETSVVAFGSYLGEVMVRNLRGRWHFPNYFQLLAALVSWNRFRATDYWYVLLGNEKVHVFRAARAAIEKTAKEFSLYEFYQRYARVVLPLETSPG